VKFALLTKRHYTNKDLINDRFGRLFHLPVQLSKMGHKGIVISGDLHTHKNEKVDIDGVPFYSIPLSLVRLYQFIRECNTLLDNFKPDMIIASGDSYLGYLGLKLARERNIPFIFDVYDNYTVFGTNRIPGMKNLFLLAVRESNLVITAGRSLLNFVQDSAKQVISIENGYDPALFHSIPVTVARQKLNIPLDEIVIGYFGSLEPKVGIEDLLKAASLLRKKIPKIRFLFAGRDNLAIDFDSYSVDYRGFLPQEKIPDLINAADVVVIPYLPSRLKQWCNACKIAEYVACRKPVVATRIADHAEIFASAPQSICNPGNPKSMAKAIMTQLNSPQLIENKENLTWRRLAGKLSDAMTNLESG